MKKFAMCLVATALTLSAFAQRTAEDQVAKVWRAGLAASQVNGVERFTRHMVDTDRWTVYSAVVRSREFHKDYLPGEPMTTMKVLSAVRTRLSTDDAMRFNDLWKGLSAGEQERLVTILRDIQVG